MHGKNLINVFGKEYALQSFWQVLSQNSKNEHISLASQLNFDLFLRNSYKGINQAGFASTKDGVRVTLPSLAFQFLLFAQKQFSGDFKKKTPVEISESFNFITAFKVEDDQYYLLIVKSGIIQPDTDVVLGMDALIQRLSTIMYEIEWFAIYIDDSLSQFSHEKFKILNFNKILKNPYSAAKYKKIPNEKDLVKTKVLLGLGAIAALAMIGGAFYAWTLYQQQLQEEERKRLEAQAQALRLPPAPWDTAPWPMSFLNACLEKYLPVQIGGWELQEFTCDGKNVVSKFNRSSDALLFPLYSNIKNIQFDANYQSAVLSQDVRPISNSGKHTEQFFGVLETQAIQLISDLQHASGITLSMQPIVDAPKAEGVNIPVKQSEFSVTLTPLDARFFMAMAPAGTRLNHLEIKGDTMSLKGIMYGQAEQQ
jgi:hypothetical protein